MPKLLVLVLVGAIAGCNNDPLSPGNSDSGAPDMGGVFLDGPRPLPPDLLNPVMSDCNCGTGDMSVLDFAIATVPDIAMQPDLTPPPDLATLPDLTVVDLRGADLAVGAFPPFMPALNPKATHVGFTGGTCCIQTHPSGKVLYLANVNFGAGTGDLHLFDGTTDTVLQTKNEPVNGYAFSGDGKYALYLAAAVNQHLDALRFVEVANPANNFVAISNGVLAQPLLQSAFFSPSKKYLVAGVQAMGVANSLDLHVIDMATGKDIYQLGNGAFDYLEAVNNDDVMLFQNLVGNNNPNTPGTLNLYALPLPGIVGGAQPTFIDAHTGGFQLSQDTNTLYYNKTNGQLWSYDVLANKATMIAPSGPQFSVGPLPSGPVGYVAANGSVHVAVNNADVWVSPAASADLFSPIYFSPDAAHVYFFKNVFSQDNKGDLYHALASGKNVPTLVASNAALSSVYVTADRLVYFANNSQQGLTGDLTVARLDGSGGAVLAMAALTGELLVPKPPLAVVYA